jgi:hypothetical protein
MKKLLMVNKTALNLFRRAWPVAEAIAKEWNSHALQLCAKLGDGS